MALDAAASGACSSIAICLVAPFRSPFFIATGSMVIDAIVRIGPESSVMPASGPSGRRPPLLNPFISLRCTSLWYEFISTHTIRARSARDKEDPTKGSSFMMNGRVGRRATYRAYQPTRPGAPRYYQ